MRKLCVLLLMCLALAALPALVLAEPVETDVLIYTYYIETDGGDLVQIAFLTEEGEMWTLSGSVDELGWPSDVTEQLNFMSQRERFTRLGTLDYDEIFTLRSLTSDLEDQGAELKSTAEDAGLEYSYGLTYISRTQQQPILLGVSGDCCFENTDPDAQTLYQKLRELFPDVPHYKELGMGPQGFIPVPFAEFCGLNAAQLSNVSFKGGYNDCEAGYFEFEMQDDTLEWLWALLEHGYVTGKANAIFTTGGSVSYTIFDDSGNYISSLEFYEGLLVRGDGMYSFELDEASEA